MVPILAAAPAAAAALAKGEIIAVGTMGIQSAAPPSNLLSANFQFATDAPRYLTLGLLGTLSDQGLTFSDLELTVSSHGTQLFTQSFDSVAAAQQFFADQAISLGMLGAGMQDILVSTEITGSDRGGFQFQYALGVSAVPEPGSWMLMLVGMTVVLVVTRRRRA